MNCIKEIKNQFVIGTFEELIQKNGQFAQLIKQFQVAEEQKEQEEGEQQAEQQAAGEEGDIIDASVCVEDSAAGPSTSEGHATAIRHVNFTAIGNTLRDRAESEGEMRRQSSAASEKPQKPDPNKAKLMTAEDSVTGELIRR